MKRNFKIQRRVSNSKFNSQTNNKTNSKRAGAAVVEAALMLPILIIITFGSLDAAQYINTGQVICNSSRTAARLATRNKTKNVNEVKAVTQAYLADIFPQLSEQELSQALSITVSIADANAIPLEGNELGSVESGSTISVAINFDFDQIRWLPGLPYSDLSTTTYFRRD